MSTKYYHRVAIKVPNHKSVFMVKEVPEGRYDYINHDKIYCVKLESTLARNEILYCSTRTDVIGKKRNETIELYLKLGYNRLK